MCKLTHSLKCVKLEMCLSFVRCVCAACQKIFISEILNTNRGNMFVYKSKYQHDIKIIVWKYLYCRKDDLFSLVDEEVSLFIEETHFLKVFTNRWNINVYTFYIVSLGVLFQVLWKNEFDVYLLNNLKQTLLTSNL